MWVIVVNNLAIKRKSLMASYGQTLIFDTEDEALEFSMGLANVQTIQYYFVNLLQSASLNAAPECNARGGA